MNDWTLTSIRFDEPYTPSQASRVTHIPRQTIYRWWKEGRLIAMSTTKTLRFLGRRLYEAAINVRGL